MNCTICYGENYFYALKTLGTVTISHSHRYSACTSTVKSHLKMKFSIVGPL